VLRGELPPPLALRREEVEREGASVVLLVQLVREYQTIHVRQIADQATELRVERDRKTHYKVLNAVVGRLEVVTQRLQQDYGLHNLNSDPVLSRLKVHEADQLNHTLVLLYLAYPLRHQH
jgi:hypothetical protein